MRWDFGMQWHQLDHMQTICTSVQADNHTNTPSTQFLQAGCSSWRPTNSVKALKAHWRHWVNWRVNVNWAWCDRILDDHFSYDSSWKPGRVSRGVAAGCAGLVVRRRSATTRRRPHYTTSTTHSQTDIVNVVTYLIRSVGGLLISLS